ncbi:hypothetical protein ScPMuIL_002892 [Solemya velum]
MPMSFIVRSSKFRHVYGQPFKKDECYENIRITRNTHDSNFCCVNASFLAVVTESAGGGSFVVLPLDRVGRVDINIPRVCGHAGAVLDIKWNPFHDNIIASASDDTTIKLWNIPEHGIRRNLTDWSLDMHCHYRRVSYLEWNPTAENILLSTGHDYQCVLWNVEQAEPISILKCHQDTVFSIAWNRDGSLFSTTSKDRKIRVVDPRIGDAVIEANGHIGAKASKSIFMGDTGKLFTTGFNRLSSRQYAIWDVRNMSESLRMVDVDISSGVLLPYYDSDTRIVFLAGKGDGNIRYFEVVEDAPYCHYLNQYLSSYPQRGLGVMPKRNCDPNRCEIMRFYKLHAAKNLVEPISMIVPRKSEHFHDDLFPPTASNVPSLSADEWISGQNRGPILVSVQDGHTVVNSSKTSTSKALQKQNGVLIQQPTITTYKAVEKGSQGGHAPKLTNAVSPTFTTPSVLEEEDCPASIKNIHRLSSCDDYITLSETNAVNSMIAAFENKNSKSSTPVTSPEKRTTCPVSPSTDSSNVLPDTETDKVHVKKVWCSKPTFSPSQVKCQNGISDTDRELKKAFFQQLEEIKSLKEQLSLKDHRIRQLEEEMLILRRLDINGHISGLESGNTDC